MIPYWEAAAPSASPASREFAGAVSRQHRIIIIITSQPAALPWPNSDLIIARSDQDLITAITGLKQQPGRDLGLPGGVRTAQRFIRLGLIDEYVLHVHPVAISTGKPLFTRKTDLQLTSAKAYPSGVLRLHYQTRPPATTS